MGSSPLVPCILWGWEQPWRGICLCKVWVSVCVSVSAEGHAVSQVRLQHITGKDMCSV